MKFIIFILIAIFRLNVNAETAPYDYTKIYIEYMEREGSKPLIQFPIYAEADGEIKSEIEWENANDENNELHNFQKDYKECMENELSVIKNQNYCVSSISLSFVPSSNRCIRYYYPATQVIGANENYYLPNKDVKKGDLIGYTNSKERLKPSSQQTNAVGCEM